VSGPCVGVVLSSRLQGPPFAAPAHVRNRMQLLHVPTKVHGPSPAAPTQQPPWRQSSHVPLRVVWVSPYSEIVCMAAVVAAWFLRHDLS
jgi:hypothetical protein